MTHASADAPVAPPPTVPTARWRDVALFSALALALVWITWSAWADLAWLGWADEQSGHILVAPLAALMLFFPRRGRLANMPRWGFAVGPALILVGLLGWANGYAHAVQIAFHLSGVVALAGAVVTVWGVEPLRRLAPMWVALLFLAPTPHAARQLVAVPMQEAGARVAREAAEVCGLGATRAGRSLRINGQDVTVAEACSGMRLVFTLLLACFVSAYTLPLREPARWAILLAAPFVAIAANVVRLVLTLWAYGRYDPATADKLHTFAGWVMVVVAFLAIEGAVRGAAWLSIPVFKDVPKAPRRRPAPRRRAAPAGVPA